MMIIGRFEVVVRETGSELCQICTMGLFWGGYWFFCCENHEVAREIGPKSLASLPSTALKTTATVRNNIDPLKETTELTN